MKILFVQLPIPKLNLGLQTGNVPLGAASIKSALPVEIHGCVDILPESVVSYLGDKAVLDLILSYKPDYVGFSLFCWNVERSLYIASKLKEKGIMIFLGGPEATSDNQKVVDSFADSVIFGEGEGAFRKLLAPSYFSKKNDFDNCFIFKNLSSPYVLDFLEPEIQDSMLVETQRGCPYSCGYCYYNKSRKGICIKPMEKVFEAVDYAIEKKISEVYLLDPSLNSRPDLKSFLEELIKINKDDKVSFHSEIRAEAVTEELADLFMEAGFKSFEIGLQSVNPSALAVMRRPTNILKFLDGVSFLKQRGISPCVDLITGLPGDSPAGIKKSVDFIIENNLEEDVQFFPLSVIPGTDFRKNSEKLGLNFNPYPPYNIISTDSFSEQDILLSLEYAEQQLGINFFPMPDLDLSYKKDNSYFSEVNIKGRKYISKLLLFELKDEDYIINASERLTQPYQIFFGGEAQKADYIDKVLSIVTGINPYTPFEIVFFEPDFRPDVKRMLESIKLKRPHFLDGDLRYLYPEQGNRAVLFTIVTSKGGYNFCGPMEREILLWKDTAFPDIDLLMNNEEFEGILIDNEKNNAVFEWMTEIFEKCDEITALTFAEKDLQLKWLSLISSDTYYLDFFN